MAMCTHECKKIAMCTHKKEKWFNTSLAGPGGHAHRLQRHMVGTPATPPRPTYSPLIKKRRLLLYSNKGGPINFRKISFSIPSFLLWRPQKSKMATMGPQNGQRCLESGLPLFTLVPILHGQLWHDNNQLQCLHSCQYISLFVFHFSFCVFCF